MKRTKILLSFVLILLMTATTVFATGGQQTQQQGSGSTGAPANAYALPRNQTLYYNGLQWGTIRGWNPYMGTPNNALAISAHRQLVYETLFMYNLLDNKLYPQIGESFSWSGQTLTVQLSPNAKWADGTAITAEDVVNSYTMHNPNGGYTTGTSGYWNYMDSVRSTGPLTVVFQAKAPPNFNPKQLEVAISQVWITQKAYWDRKIASGELGRGSGDLLLFPANDIQGSGPFGRYYDDETKVVLLRNDNYWGQHASRRGKLPAPRYVAQNIYVDNDAANAAFARAEVDVSQSFVNEIWTYFPRNISTYIPQSPYYLPGYIPTIFFNTHKPGLDDVAVRKAIAMVIDYNQIGLNAMSGYTAPKEQHMMLPAERNLLDTAALAPYQWRDGDVAGANTLLDQAGWVRGGDGVRAKGGVRLAFRVECPYGWSDWNASLEIVAQSARQVGIALETYFPEQPVWNTDMQTLNFDIIMNNTSAPGAATPWSRAYALMSSTYLPAAQTTPNTTGNWGRWVNSDADQLIQQIMSETNEATLRQLWTRLNIIYLQELPFVGLMYRPWLFHQVYEGVWTGYPKLGDNTNVPPAILLDGYGIVGLFNIRLR